jgi:hypothetical protein
VPRASRAERPTGRFEAKASCRPRIMQFTTIRAMKAPSALWISGTTALRIRSTRVTKVAMIRM